MPIHNSTKRVPQNVSIFVQEFRTIEKVGEGSDHRGPVIWG